MSTEVPMSMGGIAAASSVRPLGDGTFTADLPAEFRREVVHRDDLVLL